MSLTTFSSGNDNVMFVELTRSMYITKICTLELTCSRKNSSELSLNGEYSIPVIIESLTLFCATLISVSESKVFSSGLKSISA